MKKLLKQTIGCLVALGFNVLATSLFAQQPPVVTYTVSGTSGDYAVDFTVNNGSPGTGNQDIYGFGVFDPNGSVSSSPSTFADYSAVYAPGYYIYGDILNGTTLLYNDLWIDTSFSALPPGTSLSGFIMVDTSATAPTSLPYFLTGIGVGNTLADYTGSGNLGPYPYNPAFEGNATPAPDAGSTMPLLGVALCALQGVSRRFRKA